MTDPAILDDVQLVRACGNALRRSRRLLQSARAELRRVDTVCLLRALLIDAATNRSRR